ncbi:MAG TPA: DNA/RNA non-specific endonuclease, partial [Candidatus Limnocylindria bacterium]|nr:DNA/RNA non-specific endonuclease [Candidatus Limnocylindria bacterium]
MRSITATFLLCLLAVFTGPPACATIGIGFQLQLGNPSGASADPNNHEHYLVQREVAVQDYSDRFGQPLWASWDLTAGDVGDATRQTKYSTDPTLPAGFRKITDSDYDGVGPLGLNRGHLCPSEDRTDTDAHNDELFFLTNIMPQSAMANHGAWGTFEEQCRSLARAGNEILVLCGPGGFGTNRLPSGKVFVPDFTWKIAVVVPLGSSPAVSRISGSTRVIALKIPNTDAATNKWPTYVTSANEIQVDTGLTFFTALPPDIAAVLRSKVDGKTNPPPAITGFTPTGGGTNTSVTITGTNFTAASAVKFNGTSAAFSLDSATQITAVVPPGATSGPISVTTPDGTAISADSFTADDAG